ncbi:hypothetical protein [Paracoccus sp. ME4]|uniref:hypothetical protein n=1 Tax=Paracoccus sp. ME4 TaxID=3138066 RepID=UPI00398B5ED0
MSRFSRIAPKQAPQSDQDLDQGLTLSDVDMARQAQVQSDAAALDEAEQLRAFDAARVRREAAMLAEPDAAAARAEASVSVAPAPAPHSSPVAKPEPSGAEVEAPAPQAAGTAPQAGPRDAFAEASDTMRAVLPRMPRIDRDPTPQMVMAAYRELKDSFAELHGDLRIAAGDFATEVIGVIMSANPGADPATKAAAAFRQNMGLAFVAGAMSLLGGKGARTTFDDPEIDRIMAEHTERFTQARARLYGDPAAAAAAGPTWDDARAVPLRLIRPDSPGEDSAPRADYAGDAVITNGDPAIGTLDPELSAQTPPPPPAPANSFEARFPQVPKGWPRMQAWPQQPAYDLMKANDAGDAEIAEYMKFVAERNAKMARRAEQIMAYLREHNDPQKMQLLMGGVASFRRTRRERSNQRDIDRYGDDHHGIKWAMLLNDDVKANALNITASWGFNTAATTDGGVVVAMDDGIRFQKISKQAIQLAMHEGMARGWGSFNMAGNKEFCQEAIAVARSMNMPAKITERYGPLGMWKRVHHITPAPPGSNEAPKVETEDLGAGPNPSSTTTPDGTDLRKAGPLAPPRPDAPRTTRAMRVEADPARDLPEADPSEPFEGMDPRSLVEEDPDEETHLQMVNTGTPRPRTAADTNSYDLG